MNNSSLQHWSCKKEDTDSPAQLSSEATAKWVSIYTVPKMDCSSEERLVRMALGEFDAVKALSFDLAGRQLVVFHDGSATPITEKLEALELGARLQKTLVPNQDAIKSARESTLSPSEESGTLRLLLGINAVMFIAELAAGLFAQSAGLIADSLDMFADAAVYGLALYAVARSTKTQARAAHFAGVLQLILALSVLAEVGRRFIFGSEPASMIIIGVASIALIANISCLVLIFKHREGGAHMKASWIFSANDVLINIGIILSGALVALTGSNYPDLLVGTIVGLIVLNGARRILSLKA